MAIFELTVLAALIVGLALYLTRRQYRRALVDRGELGYPGETIGDSGLPFVVTVDPASGKLAPVTEALDDMRRSWTAIRFPHTSESRAAGFPAEKSYGDSKFAGRRAWCEKHCRGRWRVENPASPALVFWFEDERDASEFAMAWYPFKCV